MATFSSDLHQDVSGKSTSSRHGDVGDGTNDWYLYSRVADGGDATQGDTTDSAVQGGTTNGTLVALLKGLQRVLGTDSDAAVQTGAGSLNGILRSARDAIRLKRPGDSTWVKASSGNVANAAATATMPATASVTNYCTGFDITFAGATAAGNVVATLAGLSGGTSSYIIVVPAGATVAGVPLAVRFDPPLPASAANTGITLTVPALGAGNTHSSANIYGYRV